MISFIHKATIMDSSKQQLRMKTFSGLSGLALACLLLSCSTPKTIVSYNPQEINKALDDQSYQFLARFVQPASGRMRDITASGHFLKVTPGKISANLPYFGRAYSAPIGGEAGIKFESDNFTYDVSTKSKGEREISIKVNNSQEVRELFLTVFTDGSADLRVTPVNKRFISYRGEITPLTAK